jgi:hypothetical protein
MSLLSTTHETYTSRKYPMAYVSLRHSNGGLGWINDDLCQPEVLEGYLTNNFSF